MPSPAILAIGEPMIEFNQTAPGKPGYLQGYGGDTSNAIIAAARQGANCGYITRLGDDDFGRMFLDLWRADGVDSSGVGIDGDAHTAVYFVNHGAGGKGSSKRKPKSKSCSESQMRRPPFPRSPACRNSRQVIASW